MFRKFILVLTAAVAVSAVAYGATDSEVLTINATVANRANLTLAPTTINFPDADPDLVASVPADVTVNVASNVRVASGSPVNLTCLANGDLVSGADAIAISNVSWVAGGAGYVGGTLSDAAAQTVGSWTGSGARAGTMDFSLVNSWAYAVGNYTQTVDFTLDAP